MKIVHLTPGTGNFHCGSCLRDNHLIKALRRRGHEAVMVPLYLPLVTDDEPASADAPLFAGGINMYLQQKSRLFRNSPRWLDRLLDAPRLLQAAAKRAGMTRPEELGEMTVESLLGTKGRQSKEWKRLLRWMRDTERPELVSLSNGLLNGLAPAIRRELQIPVVCSLQGEDSFLDSLPEPWKTKAWTLFSENSSEVSRYVATSEWYARQMRERLQISDEMVAVVHNGLDFAAYRPAEQQPAVPTIGFLARLIKGKGLDQLVEAFIVLKRQREFAAARLKLAGTKTDADDAFIEEQKCRLAEAGLTDAVTWHPNLNLREKVAFLQSLSVLSVPATYGEAFGLYVIEALACGVPVVEPDHAGLGELVRATGGGLLCKPNDSESLASRLAELLHNPALAADLAKTGRDSVVQKFSADAMAAGFERVILKAVGSHSG